MTQTLKMAGIFHHGPSAQPRSGPSDPPALRPPAELSVHGPQLCAAHITALLATVLPRGPGRLLTPSAELPSYRENAPAQSFSV